jgi:hypothetical protein
MRVGVLAAAAALLGSGGAHAQGDAERAGSSALFGAVFKSNVPVNPALFAPGAAVDAKRMPVQQRDERRFLKDAAAAGRFENRSFTPGPGQIESPGRAVLCRHLDQPPRVRQ